jgi:pimeloyl-ACP methyl ester carboxylesterase
MSSPELHVERSGSGTPAILLHSSGLSGRQWRRLSTALVVEGVRAIVPDLTGHGASPVWPEPRPFSYLDDVEQVARLLDAEGPAHLVGHSYGGLLALLAAIKAPDRVLSVSVYDPVLFGVLDPTRDADAWAELAGVPVQWDDAKASHETWMRRFVEYWGGPGAWDALREEARGEFRRAEWVVYREVTTLATDRTPPSAYAVVTCPVLLMGGALSPMSERRVVEHLAAAMPHARRVMVEGAGHMGPLTHADKVNALVLETIKAATRAHDPAVSS